MNKISFVKESKDKIQAFSDKGTYLFTKYGKLNSFTESTISIKTPDGRAMVYDTKGSYKFTRQEHRYNFFMKTIAKYIPYAIAAFGIVNLMASFFTKNVWQGIAGVWMIIGAPNFHPNNIVCPSNNCCQNSKEGN